MMSRNGYSCFRVGMVTHVSSQVFSWRGLPHRAFCLITALRC